MKITNITNKDLELELTYDFDYDCISENETEYIVLNNLGVEKSYLKSLFGIKPIDEEKIK